MKKQNLLANNKGFTLIEAAIVVAIIGIMAAIAIPNMIGWRANRQLQGTTRVFFSDLQAARYTAIREAETVSINISVPSGDYQMFIDPNQNFVFEAGEQIVKQGSTLANITVQNVNFAGNQTQFDSRGMAAVTGDLQYVNQNGDTITIFMNSLGRISMQ